MDLMKITSDFQIVVAFQNTYEEKVLKKYDIAPLEAIGWEGTYFLIKLTLKSIPT